jgi:hypothetical protein
VPPYRFVLTACRHGSSPDRNVLQYSLCTGVLQCRRCWLANRHMAQHNFLLCPQASTSFYVGGRMHSERIVMLWCVVQVL